MTAFTDDDVAAATTVVARTRSRTADKVAEAVLAAVAPAIAARALREAADHMPPLSGRYEIADWLRARAGGSSHE